MEWGQSKTFLTLYYGCDAQCKSKVKLRTCQQIKVKNKSQGRKSHLFNWHLDNYLGCVEIITNGTFLILFFLLSCNVNLVVPIMVVAGSGLNCLLIQSPQSWHWTKSIYLPSFSDVDIFCRVIAFSSLIFEELINLHLLLWAVPQSTTFKILRMKNSLEQGYQMDLNSPFTFRKFSWERLPDGSKFSLYF